MNTDAPSRLSVLWSFARPHRRGLLFGLLLALAGSAAGLATPMVTKEILDALAADGSLLWPVLGLLGLTVLGAGVFWLQWTLLGSVGERIVLDARRALVHRYLHAAVQSITARAPGELVTRATSDTVLLREAAAASVVGIVNGAVMLVGTLVLMGVLDLVLLGVTVATVVVVTALFLLLMPGIATAQERVQEHVGRLGGRLEGAVRGVRTVKASRAEDRVAEAILADAGDAARHGVKAVRREAMAWGISWTGVQLAIIAILGIGAWRVSEGALEVSSLIAFLLYAFGLMGPIMDLTQNTTQLQSGIAAAGRIREAQAIPLEPDDGGGAETQPAAPVDGAPVLELRDVRAAYGPDAPQALQGVTLAIPRRGHVAIVGPSGAGKTTLLSLLLRFLEPQSGELRLDGVPYGELRFDEVRARLAYVEQDTPVVPGTIRENVTFAWPDAPAEAVDAVLTAVRLDEGLRERLDEPLTATSVSGGQRQRIALARALLARPDVLLLDEATAQLDGLTEAAVQQVIAEQSRRGAVVTVAHRLSTVVDADTIVVLQDGRVRVQGTHAELLDRDELYRELVAALRMEGAASDPVAA